MPHRRPVRVNRAPARVPYTRGLHEVGDRVWAWTLPDGGYGWSNAGLVAGDGASLLVDTLFDLALTREMLTAMKPITDRAPITDALITHSNGDHTHGNQLLDASVRIIAATGTAEEIAHGMAPEMLAMTQTGNLGPVATPYARDRFGHFDFSGIKLRNADQTFDRDLTIDVGGRQINLLNLGPAHTAADSVVHVPDAGVLFGGDLLFIGCTPIVWAGPIDNWVAACDAMIALDAPTVVPGHGPVTDPGRDPRASVAISCTSPNKPRPPTARACPGRRPPTPSTSASTRPGWTPSASSSTSISATANSTPTSRSWR